MKQLLGRIGLAFRILFGLEPTWWGIQAEWAEIKVEAADLFQKHNTLAARLIKSQKELRAAQDAEMESAQQMELLPSPSPAGRKAELRARAFNMTRNGGRAGLFDLPPNEGD